MPTQPLEQRAGLGPRMSQAARWIGHHAIELAAVAIPGAFGAASPAYLVLSGAVGTLWGAHEWRVARHNTRTALAAVPAREIDAEGVELDDNTDDQPADDTPIAHRGH